MRARLTLIALIAGTTLAHSAPYDGDWIADAKAKCPRSSDAYGENIVAITPRSLTFYESTCQIERTTQTGPSAWTLSLTCTGEGETRRERSPLALEHGGRVLRLNGVRWYRCGR